MSDTKTLADSGFTWREREGVKVLVCVALEASGFVNGFSTRAGGVSPFPSGDLNLAGYDEDTAENIAENRSRFLNVLGENLRLATVWQEHGDAIKVIASPDDIAETEDRADAVMSDLPRVLAAVKTADCVPILIGDPTSGAFAAIHAGWRGTVRSIVAKAVNELIEIYRSDPGDLICAIGPAAGCRNYEVGSDVMQAFAESFDSSGRYFTPTRERHALVDLHSANRDQITAAGIDPKNIYAAPFCTMERRDLFFSYRLEKRSLGRTGRLLSVIGKRTI